MERGPGGEQPGLPLLAYARAHAVVHAEQALRTLPLLGAPQLRPLMWNSYTLPLTCVACSDGREYVLRRVLRRAVRYGREVLGAKVRAAGHMVTVALQAMRASDDALPCTRSIAAPQYCHHGKPHQPIRGEHPDACIRCPAPGEGFFSSLVAVMAHPFAPSGSLH